MNDSENNMQTNFDWQLKTFKQLSTDELYDLLKLRIDVFVVEQTCYYSDLDELDRETETLHVFAYDRGHIIAYCRVLAPNVVYEQEAALGRVIVSPEYRGQKLGYSLMAQALGYIDIKWPTVSCHISAQQHLHDFYHSLGFEQISDMYLEDGIPHIGMRRIVKKIVKEEQNQTIT